MHCVYRCFDPYANSLIVDFDSVGRGVIADSVLALIKFTLAPESIMKLTGVLLIETVTFGCMSFFSASMVKVYPTLISCSELESSSSATSRVESSVVEAGRSWLIKKKLFSLIIN